MTSWEASDIIDKALCEELFHGEVSEWFKELVLKTSDSERDRGFESHLLRFIGITAADNLIIVTMKAQAFTV